jgi:hypothetical protein
MTPGSDKGSTTFQKVRQLPAPSEQDASSKFMSIRPSAVMSGNVISGICTCARARTTPTWV